MDQIQHDKIKAKLAKIKALAERGVGGEKETAMRMYEELKARYEIEDEEITLDEVTLHWFSYKNDLEEDLLTQIFYMVTGSASYHRYTGSYSRRKKRGCDCTEVEAAEITLYFNFYKEELKREMEAFMAGFKFKNNLFPDENARCYQEHKGEERERTDEEKKNVEKGCFLCGLHGWQPAATGTDRRTGGRRLMEDRQKIIAKLVKIKALAERGIGGEQQTAQVMYTTLKEKYKVTDAEIEKAAAVPVDISEIDLKKFWGIAFQLAAVAKTLQEETDICTACPYTYTDEQCTGCGTYWNMRDLRLDFEALQQRLIKAATEG